MALVWIVLIALTALGACSELKNPYERAVPINRVQLAKVLGDCVSALIAEVDGSSPAELLFGDAGDLDAQGPNVVQIWTD